MVNIKRFLYKKFTDFNKEWRERYKVIVLEVGLSMTENYTKVENDLMMYL